MTIKSLFLLCFLIVLNITNITSQEIHITPRPQKLIIKSGAFKINNETQIVFNESSKKIVKDLQNIGDKTFPKNYLSLSIVSIIKKMKHK